MRTSSSPGSGRSILRTSSISGPPKDSMQTAFILDMTASFAGYCGARLLRVARWMREGWWQQQSRYPRCASYQAVTGKRSGDSRAAGVGDETRVLDTRDGAGLIVFRDVPADADRAEDCTASVLDEHASRNGYDL